MTDETCNGMTCSHQSRGPRINAHDMPVGTIVTTSTNLWIKAHDEPGGWLLALSAGIQADWIDGLFFDGSATVIRYGTTEPASEMNDDYLQARGAVQPGRGEPETPGAEPTPADMLGMDAVARIAQVLTAEGGAPGNSLHGWRCEYPDWFGACHCVEQTARAIVDALQP
jgi:hypothetical protein